MSLTLRSRSQYTPREHFQPEHPEQGTDSGVNPRSGPKIDLFSNASDFNLADNIFNVAGGNINIFHLNPVIELFKTYIDADSESDAASTPSRSVGASSSDAPTSPGLLHRMYHHWQAWVNPQPQHSIIDSVKIGFHCILWPYTTLANFTVTPPLNPVVQNALYLLWAAST